MSHAAAAALRESPPRPSFRKNPEAIPPVEGKDVLGEGSPLKRRVDRGEPQAGESPTKTPEVINWSVICNKMRSSKEPEVRPTTADSIPPAESLPVTEPVEAAAAGRKPKKPKSKKKKVDDGAADSAAVEGSLNEEVEEEGAVKKPPKRKKKKESPGPGQVQGAVLEKDGECVSSERSGTPSKAKPSAWGAKSISPGQVPPPPHFLRTDQIPPASIVTMAQGVLPSPAPLRMFNHQHQQLMHPVGSSMGFGPVDVQSFQPQPVMQPQPQRTHYHQMHQTSVRYPKPHPGLFPSPQVSFNQPKFSHTDQPVPFTEQGLSDEIYTFVGAAMLRKSEMQARERTRQKIERCINNHIAALNREAEEAAAKVGADHPPTLAARLVLFGSYAVGLSTPNSDMDLTVVVTPFPPPEPIEIDDGTGHERRKHRTSRNEVVHFLESLSGLLAEREKLKTGVITTTKVPVVSVYDAETSIACDVSLNMGHMEKVVQLQRAWLNSEEQIDRRLGCGREVEVVSDIGPNEHFGLSQTVFISRAKALIIMTKVALRQWGLCSSFTGGLSSTSVYLLVERFLREGRAPTILDEKSGLQEIDGEAYTRRNNGCADDQLSVARLLLEFWRYLASDGHVHGYLVHDIFCVKPSEPYEQIPEQEATSPIASPVPTAHANEAHFSACFSGGASMSSVATPNPENEKSDEISEVGSKGSLGNRREPSKEFYWYGPGVTFIEPNCATIIPLHLLPDVSRRCTRMNELRALMMTSADGLTDAISGGFKKSWSAPTPITNILLDPRLVTSQHGVMYQRQHGDDRGHHHARGRGSYPARSRGRGARAVHSHHDVSPQMTSSSTPPMQPLNFKHREYPHREYSVYTCIDSPVNDRSRNVAQRPGIQPRQRQVPTTPPMTSPSPVFPNTFGFSHRHAPFGNATAADQISTPRTPPVHSGARDDSRGTPDSGRQHHASSHRGKQGSGTSSSLPPPSYFDSLQASATSSFANVVDAPVFNPTSRTGRAILSRTSSRNESPIPSD